MSPPRAVIACVGNDLVGDDGFGIAVHDALVDRPLPAGVQLHKVFLAGMDLLDRLHGEDLLVVVDAVSLGKALGTLHWLEWDDLPVLPTAAVSSHGIGIHDMVEVGRRLFPERMPQRVVLLGCEGERFDTLGQPMSPAVQEAVPEAVAMLLDALG